MEEDSVGNWMIQWELEQRVKHRIACDELEYPPSEALYASVHAWEKITGLDWLDYCAP